MSTMSALKTRALHHAQPPAGELLVHLHIQDVGGSQGERSSHGRVVRLHPGRISEDFDLIHLVPSEQGRAGPPSRLVDSVGHEMEPYLPDWGTRTPWPPPQPPIPHSLVKASLVILAHSRNGAHLRTREAARLFHHPHDSVSARAHHQPTGQLLTHRQRLAAQPPVGRKQANRTVQVINAPQSAWPRQPLQRVLEDHQPLAAGQFASHRMPEPTFTGCEEPLGVKENPKTYRRVGGAKKVLSIRGMGQVIRHTQTIHIAAGGPPCPVQRSTREYKLDPIRRKVRELHEAAGRRPVEQWLGISLDEIGRMRTSDVRYITHRYPLSRGG